MQAEPNYQIIPPQPIDAMDDDFFNSYDLAVAYDDDVDFLDIVDTFLGVSVNQVGVLFNKLFYRYQ